MSDIPVTEGNGYINLKLTNLRMFPYKTTDDVIQARVDVLKNRKISYLENLSVEFWLNYSSAWAKYDDFQTNSYGVSYINSVTDFSTDLKNCLGIVKVTYRDKIHWSNPVRLNFITSANPFVTFIIDAHSEDVDRTEFDIFDAEDNRVDTWNRMRY